MHDAVTLYRRLRRLASPNNRHIQPSIRRLQHQLLMPPRLEEITDRSNQYEPSHNHQYIRKPVATRYARYRTRTPLSGCDSSRGSGFIRHSVRVEIMAVGVWRLAEMRFPARRRGIRRGSAAGAAHVEAVLHEGDAETGARAVLGGVSGVQEVGEEEANELEGHADHTVPDEGKEGADGQAFVVDFVSGHAGGEDGGLPVGRGCVGGGLFVGLVLL